MNQNSLQAYIHQARALALQGDTAALAALQESIALKFDPEDAILLGLLKSMDNGKKGESVAGNSFGQSELKMLKQIFEPHTAEHAELFAEEFKRFHQDQPRELSVNTESDIFSSPQIRNASTSQTLTERLYPEQSHEPYTEGRGRTPHAALQELHRLAQEGESLSGRAHPEDALESRIKAFQNKQLQRMNQYQIASKKNVQKQNFALHYLHGWTSAMPSELNLGDYLTEQARIPSGGLFLRWNGKGIALNPGPYFLANFHAQGLTLGEIDFVIVTSECLEAYADVQEIYELNYQLNKLNPELHLIHYYFHIKAFQELSRILKPHFKQERNHLHSLEIFMDSPDVEKIELAEGITLHYFLAGSKGISANSSEPQGDMQREKQTRPVASLGIRLELKSSSNELHEKSALKLGYIAHASWNPLLAPHLGNCDILAVGLGNTRTSDYNKLSYNAECLGYFGTLTLLEEIAPKLLLCGEFGGREGDIRIEIAQKLRYDYAAKQTRTTRQAPVILPADKGLKVCLKSGKVQCSISGEWVEAGSIKVAKTGEDYAPLAYLAPWSTC